MNITIEINTFNAQDVEMIGRLGGLLANAGEVYTFGNDAKQAEPVAEPVAEQVDEPAPIAEEEKPKRTRKPRAKKEEEVKPAEPAEPIEPEKVEEPTPEEIAVAEEKVEEPTPEEVTAEEEKAEEPTPALDIPDVKTCTTEQWRQEILKKQIELGISVKNGDSIEPGPNAARSKQFIKYVRTLSEPYGNAVPSKLDPETLFRFVSQFKRIQWNEEEQNFDLLPPF